MKYIKYYKLFELNSKDIENEIQDLFLYFQDEFGLKKHRILSNPGDPDNNPSYPGVGLGPKISSYSFINLLDKHGVLDLIVTLKHNKLNLYNLQDYINDFISDVKKHGYDISYKITYFVINDPETGDETIKLTFSNIEDFISSYSNKFGMKYGYDIEVIYLPIEFRIKRG